MGHPWFICLFFLYVVHYLIVWLDVFFLLLFLGETFLLETTPCIQQHRVKRSWFNFYQLFLDTSLAKKLSSSRWRSLLNVKICSICHLKSVALNQCQVPLMKSLMGAVSFGDVLEVEKLECYIRIHTYDAIIHNQRLFTFYKISSFQWISAIYQNRLVTHIMKNNTLVVIVTF